MSDFNFLTDSRLARDVYQPVRSEIDGWKPVDVNNEDRYKYTETFRAQLYQKGDHYKVVYRGTEGNLADWATNFRYGLFQWSDEFRDTVVFMAKAVVQVAKENRSSPQEAAKLFTVTGHSQGGFEGELDALMFGVKGTSLDARVRHFSLAKCINGVAGTMETTS